RAMLSNFRKDSVKQIRTRSFNLNPRMTTIAAAVADLDIQDLEFGAKANDQVENFGQYEGVDNMTGDLYDSLRHRELLP
ncbi:MAG TPA: hypothetical protein VF353_03040, partial [Candidatus Binatia bacterium]